MEFFCVLHIVAGLFAVTDLRQRIAVDGTVSDLTVVPPGTDVGRTSFHLIVASEDNRVKRVEERRKLKSSVQSMYVVLKGTAEVILLNYFAFLSA